MDCVAEVRFISCCLSRRAKRSWAILSCRISYRGRVCVQINVDESTCVSQPHPIFDILNDKSVLPALVPASHWLGGCPAAGAVPQGPP
jgi:hypothetical protein